MEEVIREYVTGVSVHKRQNRFYFRILNDQQKLFLRSGSADCAGRSADF